MDEARTAEQRLIRVNELSLMLYAWGSWPAATGPAPLLLLHGWLDTAASFSLFAAGLDEKRPVIGVDLRGFGRSNWAPGGYWFPDYLRDLDALLDTLWPGRAVDLLGHSMGGNIACLYAGVRPERIARLVTVEGFGLPNPPATQAPDRYAQWLDLARLPPERRDYGSFEQLAQRLRRLNPRLDQAKALWLAKLWAERDDGGRIRLRHDPAHRRVNPVLYRLEEAMACWRRVQAPVLWVQADDSDFARRMTGAADPAAEIARRQACFAQLSTHTITDAGHMIHHDQPRQLARLVEEFLGPPANAMP